MQSRFVLKTTETDLLKKKKFSWIMTSSQKGWFVKKATSHIWVLSMTPLSSLSKNISEPAPSIVDFQIPTYQVSSFKVSFSLRANFSSAKGRSWVIHQATHILNRIHKASLQILTWRVFHCLKCYKVKMYIPCIHSRYMKKKYIHSASANKAGTDQQLAWTTSSTK